MFRLRGSEYLLCVAFYSKFTEIVRMSSTTSSQAIIRFKSLFARHSILTELLIDNGPQLLSSWVMRSRNVQLSGASFTPSRVKDTRNKLAGGERCSDCQEPAQKSCRRWHLRQFYELSLTTDWRNRTVIIATNHEQTVASKVTSDLWNSKAV